MSAIIKKETLTVEEAGRRLGLGRNSAYEAVKTGQIPSIKFGRRIVIPIVAIDEILISSTLPHSQDK